MAKNAQKENDIKELSQFALEKILDVILDIHHELEMVNGDMLIIPLLPPVVKFQSLMPADGVNFRDRYCHYRWQTLKFLANKRAIKQATLKEGVYGHRWTQNVEIEVNKDTFYQLFNEVQNKYKAFSNKPELYNAKKPLDKLESDIKKKIKAKINYSNGILYFRDKEIDFRNKQNQKDLLATLFEDPKKNWYYDEIQEKWDDRWEDVKETNPKAKDYWKKFYSAGNDINTAVAIETQVKDFIIKNTKEIRINPKYI